MAAMPGNVDLLVARLVSEKDATIASLQQQVERLAAHAAACEGTLTRMQQRLDDADARQQALSSDLDTARREVSRVRAERDEALSSLRSCVCGRNATSAAPAQQMRPLEPQSHAATMTRSMYASSTPAIADAAVSPTMELAATSPATAVVSCSVPLLQGTQREVLERRRVADAGTMYAVSRSLPRMQNGGRSPPRDEHPLPPLSSLQTPSRDDTVLRASALDIQAPTLTAAQLAATRRVLVASFAVAATAASATTSTTMDAAGRSGATRSMVASQMVSSVPHEEPRAAVAGMSELEEVVSSRALSRVTAQLRALEENVTALTENASSRDRAVAQADAARQFWEQEAHRMRDLLTETKLYSSTGGARPLGR